MKKCTFFTRCHDCTIREDIIKEVTGYTDGTFLYYKDNKSKVWHAIHPSTGLSVAYSYKLKTCVENANTQETIIKLIEFMEKHGAKSIERFETLLGNIGIISYNWQEITNIKKNNN